MMQEVLRIADHFVDPRDPDSIDAHSQLGQMCVLVLVFYVIMFIGFAKMQDFERKRAHSQVEVDVAFFLSAPPPDPQMRVGVRSISLFKGDNTQIGSAPAAAPMQVQTVTPPLSQAPPARTQTAPLSSASRFKVNLHDQAPLSVVSTNEIAALPAPARPLVPQPVTDLSLPVTTLPASGSLEPGGTTAPGQDSTGAAATGAQGTGSNVGSIGSGTGYGIDGGQTVATVLPHSGVRARGSISKYRRALLTQLAQAWHPSGKAADLVVRLTIAKDGQLIDHFIVQSSGSRRVDKDCLRCIEAQAFDPLPEWYKGESLLFEITMKKVEAQEP